MPYLEPPFCPPLLRRLGPIVYKLTSTTDIYDIEILPSPSPPPGVEPPIKRKLPKKSKVGHFSILRSKVLTPL